MANELQPLRLSQHDRLILMVIYIAIGVLSRILPHFPNVTAMTSLCILTSTQFPRIWSFITITLTLFISDLILAYLFHYVVWGDWTIINYFGFIVISFFATRFIILNNKISLWIYLVCSSFGFWVWSNLGTWFFSSMYQHTINGLIVCYIAALPFLRNAVVGDLVWMGIILSLFFCCKFNSLPISSPTKLAPR